MALPLGELSPQVTERALHPFFNSKVNLHTHGVKIPVNIPVGKSQNLQSKSSQKTRAFSIITKAPGFIMLRPIQFNYQSGRSTVKIHYVISDNPLFVNFHRIFAEKKIPELAFMGCHLPAKPSGVFQLAVVFWYGHFTLSVLAMLVHLSQRGQQEQYTKIYKTPSKEQAQ